MDDEFKIQGENILVFTGDIVDYNLLGLECLYIVYLLLSLLNNKDSVFLVRGNHEDRDIKVFHDEIFIPVCDDNDYLGLKCNKEPDVNTLFNYLPSVIYIKYGDNIIHYSHGSFTLLRRKEREKLQSFLSTNNSGLEILNTRIETLGNYTNLFDDFKNGDLTCLIPTLYEHKEDDSFGLLDYGRLPPAVFFDKKQDYKLFNRSLGLINGTRGFFYTNLVENYKKTYKISAMITGHQDTFPFLLQLPQIKNEVYQKKKIILKLL